MDWNTLVGVGVTGLLSALVYQVSKGDGWTGQLNMVLGAVVAFGAGWFGLSDVVPAINGVDLSVEGSGATGILSALAAAYAHGALFKGKPLGAAVKLGLLPRLLSLAAQLTAGLSRAAKNEKPPAP